MIIEFQYNLKIKFHSVKSLILSCRFITGFDGGEKALVGFSTGYAEYYLQEPSEDYKPIMKSVGKKILLAKIVIEYLLDEGWQNPTYEDLLQALSANGDPELNEETLIRNAQFVCDRVSIS